MEPEAQKLEDNSTNSVIGVQPTETKSTEDSDSIMKTQVPRTSELSREVKEVEPEKDCVIDVKPDGQSSSSGGDGESWTAEDGDSTLKTQIPQSSELSGEEQEKAVEPEEDCVIDVKSDVQSSTGNCESWRAEEVCRICHLSPDNSSENSELIQLGCGCKAELGFSHLHCAQTWDAGHQNFHGRMESGKDTESGRSSPQSMSVQELHLQLDIGMPCIGIYTPMVLPN